MQDYTPKCIFDICRRGIIVTLLLLPANASLLGPLGLGKSKVTKFDAGNVLSSGCFPNHGEQINAMTAASALVLLEKKLFPVPFCQDSVEPKIK